VFIHDGGHHQLGLGECRRLLGSAHLGRVALSVAAMPSVLPVLYRVVDDRIVFGVECDLYEALCDNIVAFEVDHVDEESHQGWTVLVVGRSLPADDLYRSGFVMPGALSGRFPDRLIGISIDRLSGRGTVEPEAKEVVSQTSA
jgi:hypothetical protein